MTTVVNALSGFYRRVMPPTGKAATPRPAHPGRGTADVHAALAGRDVPVTAQQLFIEMRDQGNRLGIATIYRTLHELEDLGHIHGFYGPEGTAFRACSPAPHYHLISTSCGRVQEHPTEAIADWDKLVPRDFLAHSCTIEINGICDRCNKPACRPEPAPRCSP
jgi:Fur family ferric uptake transcriptional regulator